MENSNEQNMELILSMIRTARKQFADESRYYLLWGTSISLACILQYLLIKVEYDYNFIGWLVFVPLAMVIQVIMLYRQKATEKVKTHIETVMTYMWIAFGISLGIVLFAQGRLQENTYPIVLCLYAISVFIAGGALNLNALIIGAICCWIIAIISFFVTFEVQLLLLAAAVIVAYVIPGLIIRSRYNRQEDVQ
jgi:hypothetical protein